MTDRITWTIHVTTPDDLARLADSLPRTIIAVPRSLEAAIRKAPGFAPNPHVKVGESMPAMTPEEIARIPIDINTRMIGTYNGVPVWVKPMGGLKRVEDRP